MDIVVYLAITVLGVVFIISLLVLIIMCRRKYEYNRLLVDQSLRFSKLRHDNVDDIIQLSPHISNALNSNQWVYDVSGILEHCVAVLKLCHTLTDKLAKIPLNSISPQLNDVICQATARVVPRFDDLLQSMAAPNVDVRLIEARVVALVTTCWSLVSPFYLMNAKYKEVFGQIINDMEIHQKYLQLAVDQATINATTGTPSGANGSPPTQPAANGKTPPTEQRKTVVNETAAKAAPTPAPAATTTTPGGAPPPSSGQKPPQGSTQPSEQKRIAPGNAPNSRTPPASHAPPSHQQQQPLIRNERSASVSLRPNRDESRQELLSDEAPADPSA